MHQLFLFIYFLLFCFCEEEFSLMNSQADIKQNLLFNTMIVFASLI